MVFQIIGVKYLLYQLSINHYIVAGMPLTRARGGRGFLTILFGMRSKRSFYNRNVAQHGIQLSRMTPFLPRPPAEYWHESHHCCFANDDSSARIQVDSRSYCRGEMNVGRILPKSIKNDLWCWQMSKVILHQQILFGLWPKQIPKIFTRPDLSGVWGEVMHGKPGHFVSKKS
jgi:hypothetical protein